MTPAPASPRGDGFPVFLLGLHRGGTTFVQRILNCHEDVTLWGENLGLISRLRPVDEYEWHVVDRAAFAEFSTFADEVISWASPVDASGYLEAAARFLESMYATSPFWGFKEIRHGSLDDISFLKGMFPDSRLVLLLRRPRDVLLSRLHVSWSDACGIDAAKWVETFVREYDETATAFRTAEDRWPDSVVLVDYESLRDRDAAVELFDRVGVPRAGVDVRLLDVVLTSRVNSSFGDVARVVPETDRSRVLAVYDEIASERLAVDKGQPT